MTRSNPYDSRGFSHTVLRRGANSGLCEEQLWGRGEGSTQQQQKKESCVKIILDLKQRNMSVIHGFVHAL